MNETCMKHALKMPDIGGCTYCEIDRLKAELEYTKEMSNAFMDERNNLKSQLSEARAEVESIGYKPLTVIKEEARQEAARECLKIIEDGSYKDIEVTQDFICITDDVCKDIKQRFGLEG